jgi:hypothetical protein
VLLCGKSTNGIVSIPQRAVQIKENRLRSQTKDFRCGTLAASGEPMRRRLPSGSM